MLKVLVSCFSFVACIVYFVNKSDVLYFRSKNVTFYKDSNLDRIKTFAKFCGQNTKAPKILNCYCKWDKIFKFGCRTKVEIVNTEPLIAIFHGLFKDKLQELTSSANAANFKPIRLGSEYGFSKLSNHTISHNGVLEANNFATKFVYDRLLNDLQILPKCQKMAATPKSTIVKYRKGHYFGVHYDANNYSLERSLGTWIGGRVVRGLVESMETCRHRYSDHNIFMCLYKLFTGKLQTTEYWDTSLYGPRLISCMVQLSDVRGGETFFPISNVAVHTNRGDMLIWANVNDEWNRYDASMHGGCPVLSDEKLIIVVFVPGKCNTIKDINYHLRL